MKLTWVIVANSTNARVFTIEKSSSPLIEIEGFAHTEGRLHDFELTTDLPGKIRGEGGIGGHTFEQATDPKAHEADIFAQQIAHYLEEANNLHKFDQLLVVAEPAFLGLLRKHFTENVKKQICFELDKNITKETVEEIRSHLPQHLPAL